MPEQYDWNFCWNMVWAMKFGNQIVKTCDKKFKYILVCGIQQLGIDSISHALVNTKLSSRKRRAFQKGYKRRKKKILKDSAGLHESISIFCPHISPGKKLKINGTSQIPIPRWYEFKEPCVNLAKFQGFPIWLLGVPRLNLISGGPQGSIIFCDL